MHSLLILLCWSSSVVAQGNCFYHKPFVRFSKVKSCFKSTLPLVAWKTLDDVGDCMKLAREKNGLAFNFSPLEVRAKLNSSHIYRNCQVLGCPETENGSTLIQDMAFDYYSAFGNLNGTENSTCIKSMGVFSVVQTKLNHTKAVEHCQSLGGDLADILGEVRTNSLATLLQSIKGWYKAAYVGLDDIGREGVFETPLGNLLQCTNYRAWAPGHPRPKRRSEDCVILDADRVWRAVNCKIKLGFICEFYPNAPQSSSEIESGGDCSKIKDRKKKKKCITDREFFDLFNNSSRLDQCALLNEV